MRCDSCQLLRINGLVCHETGCPQAHVGTLRECDWCGTEFGPETRWQRFCCDDCTQCYHVVGCESDEIDADA